MLTKDTKLRFWCQKVLPLVYDDSLSYYELLNKVVLHLNQNTENINQLIDFYNTFAEDVEDIIQQMMEDGDFNEIVADTLGSIVAEEYDPTKSYIIFDYCIFESKLYRANGSTTGVFDPEKWDEKTVGYDLTTIQNYIYSLNAGNVAYDSSETYDDDTVGKELKDLNNTLSNLFNAGATTHDDCNNFVEGLFKYGTDTLNIPESGYGFVIGYTAQSKQWKWQIALTTNANPHMYKRNNINNSGWSDWIRVSDEEIINILNSAINNEKDELNAIQNNIIIEQGGIGDASGQDADNEARLRTKGFLPPYFNITVAQPTTYDIRVKGTYYYDENDNFVQYLERNSYSVTVDNATNPNKYKVRLSFWANDREQAITPSDLILSNYQVTDGIQTQIIELNSALNAITPLTTTPTNGSTKGITSGAVYEALKNDPSIKSSYLATGAYVEISKVTQTAPTQKFLLVVSPTDGGVGGLYSVAINSVGTVFLSTLVALTNGISITTGTNKVKLQSGSDIGACYIDLLMFDRSILMQIYRSDTGLTS